MSASIEQELFDEISHKSEERLTVPVVKKLYETYKETGCLSALARMISRMPDSNRAPLIHTLGSHVTKEKPIFVFAVAQAKGIDQTKTQVLSASVDLLWALSLILDDIIDNDTVRAGKESAWVKFGKTEAHFCINAGLQAVREELVRHFSQTGWTIMDSYINRAMKSVQQHPLLTFETDPSLLRENYINRNDFYCAAPVKIVSLGNQGTSDKVAIDTLRNVTIAGQILNDLKDMWPEFDHIRPNFSDFRNRLVTIPIKQMYTLLNDSQRIALKQLWNEDSTKDGTLERLMVLVRASEIKSQVVESIKHTYCESVIEFEFVVSNPSFRAIFREWINYKLHQSEFQS